MTFQIWSSMTEAAQQDHMSVSTSLSPSVVSSVTEWAAFPWGCFTVYQLDTPSTFCVQQELMQLNPCWGIVTETRKEARAPVHRKGYTNYKSFKKRASWPLFCREVFHKDKRRISKRSWRSYVREVKDNQDEDCKWKFHDGYLAEHWLGKGWELWANQMLSLGITVCPFSAGITSNSLTISILREKQAWNPGLKYWPLGKG